MTLGAFGVLTRRGSGRSGGSPGSARRPRLAFPSWTFGSRSSANADLPPDWALPDSVASLSAIRGDAQAAVDRSSVELGGEQPEDQAEGERPGLRVQAQRVEARGDPSAGRVIDPDGLLEALDGVEQRGRGGARLDGEEVVEAIEGAVERGGHMGEVVLRAKDLTPLGDGSDRSAARSKRVAS
jgi:hypothetical protein